MDMHKYVVASNVAVGLDVKYLIWGGQAFTVQGQVSGSVRVRR